MSAAAGLGGPRPLPTPPAQFDGPDDTLGPPAAERPPRGRVGRLPVVVTAVAVLMLIAGVVLSVKSVVGTHHNSSAPPPAPSTHALAPPPPTTPPPPLTPTLSRPVTGADGLGFIGETARCDPGNPPAAVVRTAKSLAVVCQNLSGSYYYRGERIRDGAHIELSNAERVEDGFDVTNPVDGVVYEVRPNRLRIISFGHVDSSEPVLQYATAS